MKTSLGRWLTVALVVALVGSTTACTDHGNRATRAAAATSHAPLPSTLKHFSPKDETILASLDSMTGSVPVGAWPVTTKYVMIYLTCAGPGVIQIVMHNVGTFPLNCSTVDPAPTVNRFQVSYISDYTVSIKARPRQLWAVTVAVKN